MPTDKRGPGQFNCELCGRVYKYHRSLLQHSKYECQKEPAFGCNLCPYKAKKRNTLKSHMAFKHSLCPPTLFTNNIQSSSSTSVRRSRPSAVTSAPTRPRRGTPSSLTWLSSTPCVLRHSCEVQHQQHPEQFKYECQKEPAFGCNLCPYKAKKRNTLKSHMAFKHSLCPPTLFTNNIQSSSSTSVRRSRPSAVTSAPTRPRRGTPSSLTWLSSTPCVLRHFCEVQHQQHPEQFKYECQKEPAFGCNLCPYKAKKRNTLKSHMAFKHSLCPPTLL
ncbi:hypothetical protein J6590_014748 [Homalodisca vitripennis]|nr:hypothetical protein J6590_014748 [Homalodisca vitripennis]